MMQARRSAALAALANPPSRRRSMARPWWWASLVPQEKPVGTVGVTGTPGDSDARERPREAKPPRLARLGRPRHKAFPPSRMRHGWAKPPATPVVAPAAAAAVVTAAIVDNSRMCPVIEDP
ncbi:hypothetical protein CAUPRSCDRAFT_11874 [Caulochytrium protostelioides]|uniref:Uncharacterized protein n=1 Tax=Caulochytrium protostelioides TaxID=1555241 RepID=A0A4P9WVT8_9FUNG|nr:hypothetical protein CAUPRSCDRAFT_11874 [Caulochytrium protostelioides]